MKCGNAVDSLEIANSIGNSLPSAHSLGNQVRELTTVRLRAGSAEHGFGGGIEFDDAAGLIHADDGVEA